MTHKIKFAAVLPLDDFATARQVAQRAEESGFYALAAEDHFFVTGLMGQDRFHPRMECFTLLSALAPLTQRVKLTQIVAANSFRHPALTAKIVSTLHHITGGRVELGIGAGWFREEYDAFGFPYAPPEKRVAQLAEGLEVVRRLWTEREASFAGEWYRIEKAPHEPKPAPLPRVMLGGGGRHIVRLAARMADVLNLIPPVNGALGRVAMEEAAKFDLSAFARRVGWLEEECRAIGRDAKEIELSALVYVALGASEGEADAFVQAMAQTLGVPDPQAIYRSPNTLVGTAQQIAEEIRRRASEHRLTYYFCSFLAPGMFERFCREVMPQFV
jgi:probable F420-dependent oxidoreductase